MKKRIILLLSVLSYSTLYCQQSISTEQINNDSIFSIVDSAPKFPSGDVYTWLNQHIIYPHSAVIKDIEGTVYVSFVVEKNGAVSTITLLRGVNDSINKEALRVISQMPVWSAGTIKGETVRVKLMLPIKFKLIEHADTGKVHTTADQAPKFIGNYDNWLASNIKYDGATSGIVYLDVIVEKDGSITNVKILHSALGPDSDKMNMEAIRVAKLMPKWNPANQGGKLVRFEAAIGVNFKKNDTAYNKMYKVYCDTCVDKSPEFVTGDLRNYLKNRMRWPREALRNHAQGRVVVSFIIEKDGNVSDIEIASSDNTAFMLKDDALQVIYDMKTIDKKPKWTPGYKNGKPVRVKKFVTLDYTWGNYSQNAY